MEQKPQPLPAATGVLASIIAAPTVATTAASSGPSPAHRFLPSMAAPSKRTTRLVSTEVTDALGRKTCLLPSLPRKASTTPILAAAGAGCLPGGILSRALTGGLPVKLSPTPLAKASDCVKAIDPAAKPGTRGPPGPPVVSMGILARTLSAPADLLTTSAPSEAAFRLAPVSGSPIVLSSGGAAVPTASLPLLSAATSTATPSFATFATRVTTATLTTTQLPPALASFTTALMTAQTTTASSVPALSKTILLNPILSKALAPAGQPPLGAPRTLTSSHPTISLVWPPELARAEARAPALAERSASLPETSSAALSEALTPDNKQSAAELPTAEPTAPDATPAQSPAVRAEATQPTSPACQGEPTDSGDDDSVSPRSITTTSTSNTFASTPSFAKLASLRDEEDDTANKTGLSDSCASSSSLSTATSPGLSCAPCAPGVPPGLGLDGIAAPEPASTAPLFTDGPDDLLDVADALNVLSSVDDDAGNDAHRT
ncbi:hypothetical protein ONE63_006968 [Megalurothrips usitatus]|uniref:Mucin-5AC-like n=1 Tax=Megalurothrips usitatus TaxID=439358 RepID=A0AAV7XTV6_9NEOP|nr:hypothetical protein ONE63_006968 [Megalurothrips usitatus]